MNTLLKVYRMEKKGYRLLVTAALFAFCSTFLGCHVQIPKKRGLLFRGDWAFEINRTPWVGDTQGSGCDVASDEEDGCGEAHGLQSLLPHPFGKCKLRKKRAGAGKSPANDETGIGSVEFRRHCGLQSNCSREKPCGTMPGCGIWVDPKDKQALTRAGFGPGMVASSCCLTPNCTQGHPCGLTQRCGLPIPAAVVRMNPVVPTPAIPHLGAVNPPVVNPPVLNSPVAGPVVPQQPIVISSVPGGGIAVGTGMVPVGSVVPPGGILPNGGIVGVHGMIHRSCGLTPLCTAGRPCGMTPQCGIPIPPGAAQQNVLLLAAGLGIPQAAPYAVPGTVGAFGMQAAPPITQGGMVDPLQTGLLREWATGGMTPPGGSAGYAHQELDRELLETLLTQGEEGEESAPVQEKKKDAKETVARSSMPTPRHHPLPTRPTFERSKGMSGMSETPIEPGRRRLAASEEVGDREDLARRDDLLHRERAAIQQAYLKGMIAAMKQQQAQQNRIAQVAYTAPRKQGGFLQGWNPFTQTPNTQVPVGVTGAPRYGTVPTVQTGGNPYPAAPHSALPRQQAQPFYRNGDTFGADTSAVSSGNSTGNSILGFFGLAKSDPARDASAVRKIPDTEPQEMEMPEIASPTQAVRSDNVAGNNPKKPTTVAATKRYGLSAPLPPTVRQAGYTDGE